MKFRLLFPLAVAFHFVCASETYAAWLNNGAPVSTTIGSQSGPTITADGTGGAIMTWMDSRAGGPYDIYAQRIDASGNPLWTKDGVAVCAASNQQYFPFIVSDGAGGAIITWQDGRSGVGSDVYAQRVNGSGVVQWTANGVAISAATNDQAAPNLAADGAGGAIIVWDDFRNAANYDIYAQRINAAGTVQWAANGVALCVSANNQSVSGITSDGASGAIVSWTDSRSGIGDDVYAQRINSVGAVQWAANGVALCTSTGDQASQSITTDGTGGAVAVWHDNRSGTAHIYAQRINSAGVVQWTANGTPVCMATGGQYNSSVILDGAGGVIIAWVDYRVAIADLYAQRLSLAGAVQWAADGVAVCTASGNQDTPVEVPDGAGGAIITWSDARAEPSGGDVYAQHVDVSGTIQWTYDGVALCNSPGGQYSPTIAADGSGNAIVTWPDLRGGAGYDVYAQRVEGRFGYWGKPEPTIFAVKDVPADQGGKVRVEWYASQRDKVDQQVISHYTIWRAIDQAAFASASADGVSEVKLSDPASKLTGRAIRREKGTSAATSSSGVATDYFWELIGQQDATYRYAYSFTASTSFDSTGSNPATHRFQVVAHAGYSQFTNWPSNILTGRSVDNIAPPAPLFLTAQRFGNYVHLRWNGVHLPDLGKYTVYRATSTGVTPILPNFLADDNDTLLTDTSPPASALYYIVTATDVHQNQGAKSNEAAVAPTTGVGNLPPITALSVLQNHPNPFSDETRFELGLPLKGDVRVDVYDVAGRRVRTALMPAQSKGWNAVRLSARDDRGALLPSGVYFYRVHAGAETVTKKMVIAR